MTKYKRVLLKVSGEGLAGDNGFGLDTKMLNYLAGEIKLLVKAKVEVGVVVGGGNMFRGASLKDFNRVEADQMGMLATVINALAVRDVFEKSGLGVEILSAVAIPGVVEKYQRRNALNFLQSGKVVIFAGGTGNPLVTTDSALALRGIELQADLLLKATNVDGVFSADPKKDPNAKFFASLSYAEVLQRELKVMDLGAFTLCRDHKMQLRIFNLRREKALIDIVKGKDVGSLICSVATCPG